MKDFFSKVFKDALPKIVAAVIVAGLALLVQPVRTVLFTEIQVPAWLLLLSLLAAGFGLARLVADKVEARIWGHAANIWVQLDKPELMGYQRPVV